MHTPNNGRLPDECGENPSVALTLEEQFEISRFNREIEEISLVQAKALLIQIHRLVITQKATFRSLMGEKLRG